MVKPLNWGFNMMESILKSLGFVRKKIVILSTISAILLAGVLIVEFNFQEAEANLVLENLTLLSTQEELVLLEENSLVPIVNPLPLELKVVQKLPVVVTAYSSSVWETDDNPYITAAGTWVREGIIANNLLPFGTKVRLPEIYGDKIFVVEDRMSWKKGNYQVDIWLPSYWEAKNFGAKKTYIEVLEG
jgi:3D (Asp-Asp-Asp) domain-containing protein